MSIKIIHANSWEWMLRQPEKSVDHIITDYQYGARFELQILKRICKGNIITFAESVSDLPAPDEKAYWIKPTAPRGFAKALGRFVEEIYIYRQEGSAFKRFDKTEDYWRNYVNWYDDYLPEKSVHAWQKPLSLVERLVRIYTESGDVILDPFCGSGTTLEACNNLGRDGIGIDMDIEWYEYCKEKFK